MGVSCRGPGNLSRVPVQDHGWRETWHAEAEDRPCLQCVLCIYIYIYIYINFCLAQDLQWPDPDYHADADAVAPQERLRATGTFCNFVLIILDHTDPLILIEGRSTLHNSCTDT